MRPLLDTWDCYLAEENLKDKINSLVENPNFTFLFRKDKDIFGAPEESRVTFAKMKTKDKEMPSGWEEEATFMAINLSKVVQNQESNQSVLTNKDIKKIKILDKTKAYDSLLKQSKASGGAMPGSSHAQKIALIIRKAKTYKENVEWAMPILKKKEANLG